MTFLSACPIKLEVSSTRPAPHNGLLSSAARNGRGPNSWVWRACSMGRSMSHGSSLRFNESLAKGHHCSEAYGCLLGVQTVQHSLEASIHEDRFNHLVIGDARVRLQNDRQGQLRGSNGRVPSLAWPVEGRQFLLERFIAQIVPVMARDVRFIAQIVPVMARDATNNVARRIRCTICLRLAGKGRLEAANETVACLFSLLSLETQLIVA